MGIGEKATISRRRAVASGFALATAGLAPLSPGFASTQSPNATPVSSEKDAGGQFRARGGAIRIIRPGTSLENFNPAAFAQDPQVPLSYLEPLLRSNPKTMEPMPWLAEGWMWRDDGLRLLLTIREGIHWHDMAELSAADAEFSYNVYREDVESAVAGLFSLVESIETTAEREVSVRFLERDPNWIFNVATLPIFSRQQYESDWTQAGESGPTLSTFDWQVAMPIGTGPWQIESWDARSVRFARFDGYWGQPPWLDSIEVVVDGGARERFEAWEIDTGQLLWPVSVKESESVRDDAGRVVAARAAAVMFAAFNFDNPSQTNGSLWSDLRVRQAASLAIDRARYAEEVFGGFIFADAVGTIAQPWAYDDSLPKATLNREAASLKLSEAGWIDYDGDGIREDANGLPLRPIAIMREDSGQEFAAVMARVARDLFEVGIGLSVEALADHEFEDRWITRRDFDLICYAYALLPGFTDFDLYGSEWDIRSNPAGWNPGGYANTEADAAIEEFLGAVSIERQRVALARLQRAVNDDLFGLWLGFPDDLILVGPEIEGFEPDIAWQTAQTWTLWRSSRDR